MKRKYFLAGASLAFLMALGVGASLIKESPVRANAASTDSWSMIGSASSWGTDVLFKWDSENKFYGKEEKGRFSLETNIEKDEEFKIRKDSEWTISIGYGGNAGQGIGAYLDNQGGNFKAKEAGFYILTLCDGVAGYEDRSYGFAICKPIEIAIMGETEAVADIYYEDYSNSGYQITYDSSSFHKEGYVLEGIYSDSTYKNKVASGSYITAQSCTLYAKYNELKDEDVYFYDPRGFIDSENACVYAYDDLGNKNHDWPGVAMTYEGDHLWSAKVSSQFNKIIFSATINSQERQGYDLDFNSNTFGKTFVFTNWGTGHNQFDGEFWDSVVCPYNLVHDSALYPLSLNTSVDDTVCEYFNSEVALAASEELMFNYYEDEISPLLISLSTGDNNAVKKTDAIYPHNNATSGVYMKKQGSAWYLWVGGYEEVHEYLLEVTHSDTTKNQYNVVLNADTEYMTEENVPVVAGDTLAFYIDGVLQTINPKLIGNNNCYSNDGVTTVRLNMNSKIYVDFTNGTCFCDGMIAGEYGLVVNNNYIRMSHNDNPADPTFDEWYKQGYSFAKDDVIQFVNTTSTTDVASVFSVKKINPSSAQGFAIVDDKLVCTAEGGKSTDIYVKFKYGADEVYFGDVAEDLQAAINYAKLFNIQMNSICTLDDTTSKDDMQNAWLLAEVDFGMLIESSQNILKNATTSHANEDIKTFVAQYDYIIAKYGTKWSLNNFVSRTPVSLAMFQNNFVGVTSENTIQIVVIAAVVAATAAGAFLFFKYRKEN